MVEMRWRNKEEFIEISGRTNVVIAAYITAQARLKLYGYLEKLRDRVLYTDTDSVIFIVKQGEWQPPLGDYLGELTDEVPANSITQFVTGGPKLYAYKLHKPDGDGIQTVCKNPTEEITRLAEFLEIPNIENLVAGVVDKCSFNKLKENKLMPFRVKGKPLFRKGKIGDWKNWFTVAQNEQFDAIYRNEMKDVNISFSYE
ncbi:unnamed protein product [Mytilus coruscus]|uniref:Sulfotransferase domain-containing protein n=1 Tax=Mytilus coruscus TaxID=42192 RepID=A0A6J8AS45_MYTCO|nr:unnamed protein product [Mytilus coruscus]